MQHHLAFQLPITQAHAGCWGTGVGARGCDAHGYMRDDLAHMAVLRSVPSAKGSGWRRAQPRRSDPKGQGPIPREGLSVLSAGRLMGLLYVLSGLITLASPVLPEGAGFRPAQVLAVGISAIIVGLLGLVLPWHQWHPRVSLVTGTPVAFVLIALLNFYSGDQPYKFSLFFVVTFVWIGLSQPRGTAVAFAPLAAIAYVVPIEVMYDRGMMGRGSFLVGVASLAYALPVFILIGEATSWVSMRLQDAREALYHRAHHDPLTGLPNRLLFAESMADALEAAKHKSEGCFVVAVLDLDNFKDVNDSLGHAKGDQLLKQLAARLAPMMRAGDTFARLGGDEFGLLAPALCTPHDAQALAQRVLDCLEEPFWVDGIALSAPASIGFALFPADGETEDELLSRADMAMYAAKAHGHAVRGYSASLDPVDPNRLTLASDFRRALDEGELVAYFQPVIRLTDSALVGMEALARWHHPTLGVLAPAEFLAEIERGGLWHRLTDEMLKLALGQCKAWSEAGHQLFVAVNLSSKDLLRHDLVERIAESLEQAQLPSSALELEVLEDALLIEPVGTIAALSRMGLRMSLDDFGTGYSSLGRLTRLPVEKIKIDRSFVGRLGSNQSDDAIVEAVVELGQNLGISVVAEGIETDETRRHLMALGCPLGQGYLFSQPMPPAEAARWIESAFAGDGLAEGNQALGMGLPRGGY